MFTMKRTFKNLLVTGGAGFIGSNFIRYVFEKTDFSGRIVNFDRQSVSEVNSNNAEIRAYKSDGTLVARSRIATADNYTENYRLVVPLSTGSSTTAAKSRSKAARK